MITRDEMKSLVEAYGETLVKVVQLRGMDVDAAYVDAAVDQYLGCFADLTAWAEDTIENMGILNDTSRTILDYFDFEAYGRDQMLSGEIDVINYQGDVYIFSNR
jgi:antirestriction protein